MLAGSLSRPPQTAAELIDPALAARLDRLDVLSRKTFAGKLQGERRSKRRGRSVEFDDYRPYVPGDDPRHIDWNVLARLDRLFIKVFQEEEDLAVHLIVDASASMNAGAGASNKMLYAARLAAAVGYIALVNNNRVLCSVLGPVIDPARPISGLRQCEPLRGRRGAQRLCQFLLAHAFSSLGSGTGDDAGSVGTAVDFAAAMRAIAARPSGRGACVVLSDLLLPPLSPPGYEAGLRLLAAAGVGKGAAAGQEAFVFQLLAPEEIDPAPPGTAGAPSADPPAGVGQPSWLVGDLRLIDAESGRPSEVTVTPELLTQYRRSVAGFVRSAHDFCAARGMSHSLVNTGTPIESLVTTTLRRVGLLQ